MDMGLCDEVQKSGLAEQFVAQNAVQQAVAGSFTAGDAVQDAAKSMAGWVAGAPAPAVPSPIAPASPENPQPPVAAKPAPKGVTKSRSKRW